MAVIHNTNLTPNKLELLTAWLPGRPWYSAGTGAPDLAKAGGFRLDDPEGVVGIEFLVVTDSARTEPTAYLVPMTYRGAPLAGADHALVGTMEHGVLGRRWAYDGCHDPVLVAQLLALIDGRAPAQNQNVSDTPDREVTRSCVRGELAAADFTAPPVDDRTGTELAGPHGTTLRLHRVLRPTQGGTPARPAEATGHVAGSWHMPDDTHTQGLLAVLQPGPRASQESPR
ncbi:maltokinase N-terminal cap-like domain-containing protein [Krasilnikovia sp. MM14-A1259]|uniref:maltokinase N-terminal cap-like domain-containing protein n=1 Tax=Krasilnikovia sp. MM14-A1259 TaxID=3373539 RepID=UPI003826065B